MSQYIEFYVKKKEDDKFIRIASYSHNSSIYESCSSSCYIPYGKVKCLNQDMVRIFKEYCAEEIKGLTKDKEYIQNTVNFIKECNNSLEEKMNLYYEEKTALKEIDDLIESHKYAALFFSIIETMMEEENEVYAGIECGDPTFEDIVS